MRTPYTNGEIKEDNKYILKFQNKKHRDKTNNLMMKDHKQRQWPQCEIDSREKDLRDIDFQIGYILSQASALQCKIDALLKRKVEQEFMINICKKTQETLDWCGYVEEEHYGIRPEVSKVNIETLNRDIVLGYLSERVPPALLIELNKELKGEQ